MPILWRYLLSQYFKVLLLCTAAFILLLLSLRLEEIAHFATLGPSWLYIFQFVYYQIPYILPIALPISALMSALILLKRLSKDHELTAMRAAGLPIHAIIAPLLIAATFLSMINFYVVSDLATDSHLSASFIKSELRNVNPLLLLNNKHLMKLKGIHFDTLGSSRLGESASKTVLAMPNKKNGRINLLLADSIKVSPEEFTAKSMTLISSIGKKQQKQAQNAKHTDLKTNSVKDRLIEGNTQGDDLLVENISVTHTPIENFSQMIQKKTWNINDDHLTLSLLLVRLNEQQAKMKNATASQLPESDIKTLQRRINRIYSEIARRLSAGLAIFTFTLIGTCSGLSIGRKNSVRGMIIVIGLLALYLTAFFSARNIGHLLTASLLLYSVPHLLITLTSFWMLRRTSRGVE